MKSLNKILNNATKSANIILLPFESKNYREYLKELLEFSLKKYKKICYITLNDPFDTITQKLSDKEKSKIFFIDCVTSTVKATEQKENVIFVSSPHALTEISIALKKTIEKIKTDFVIFDSISSMLVYEQSLTVLKFIHSIVLMLRKAKLNTIFIILKEDVSEEVVKDLAMFVDVILKV